MIRKLFVLSAVLISLTSFTYAYVYFNDGEYHAISGAIFDSVIVDDGAPGVGTQVELKEGGYIRDDLASYNISQVSISGGSIGRYLVSYHNSTVTFSGGRLERRLMAFDSSNVSVSGGQIGRFETFEFSKASLSGGWIQKVLSYGYSQVSISGGSFIDNVWSLDEGLLIISGGLFKKSIYSGMYSSCESTTMFIGEDFKINGNSINYGRYYMSDFASGHITGTLQNGDLLDNDFGMRGDSCIILVPEPVMLLLLNPNGGETLTSVETYPIRWLNIGSVSEVLIEYSINNGSNWTPVQPPNVGNNGLYNWLVPAVNTNQCLVRISDVSDPNISDTSDGVFTIKSIGACFQGLGFILVGDYTYSESYGVSSDGSVVVGEGSSASGREAFRWQNGQMTGLGNLPNGYHSRAQAVSADGSVIVGGSSSVTVAEAILWKNGHMTAMGILPGGSFSVAYDVSADGTVIVGRSSSASGTEAFRWQNGQMTGLGDLPGGVFYSTASAVSPDGTVVVGMSHSGSYYEAFRWENGQMTGLGNLYGNRYSEAEDVSANGLVVVGHGGTHLGDEAFRWQNGQMTGLGDLPGQNFYSHAHGVSADGLVIVGTSHSYLGQEAFIWNADDGMMSLKYVLENKYGLDLTGWRLECARAISDDGLNIVGYGTNPSGKIEAWIATFPSIGGVIDFVDLALFIDRWLENECSDVTHRCGRADINRDREVDFTDYSWLTRYWSSIAPAPDAASNPEPNDTATDVGVTADLNWTAGSDAAAHGVYFGTNPTPDTNEFQGYQSETAFDPGTLATSTTYYWQVNEVGLGDTTTGEVWSFTTMVDPNLVGLWKFDETSGVIAYDSSGKENHGQLVDGLGNGLVWAPGEGALNFDGSNNLSRVVIPTVGMSTTAGTIAIWANLAEPQIRGGGRSGRGYFFGCDNGVKDRILLYMDNSNTQLDVRIGDHSETNIIALGTLVWYHIALTWNSGSYMVYLNGSEIAAGTYGGLTTLPSTADIGNNGGSSRQSFHGLMGDVQVYDKSLSTTDIQQLYQDVAN
ncbi:MAG: LamG-like jellyroll fold domain-containing protein [Planctomycetota bacterium]